MKLTSCVARLSAAALAGFALAVALDFAALPLFSLAVGTTFLAGAFGDYAARPANRYARVMAAPKREIMPLAA